MSGLEKFQANEKWRSQFKQFLLMDRKPTPQPTAPIIETQHFSLDIEDDLKTIIEQKITQKGVNNIQTLNSNIKTMNNIESNKNKKGSKMLQQEDKENQSFELNKHHPLLSTGKKVLRASTTLSCCDESTYIEEQEDVTQWQQRISDESFEAMEKMCDKTVSDPNSTLYQYIHSNNKEQIVEKAKQRSLDKRVRVYDEEAKALERLLNELRVEEQTSLENESPLKGIDVTQLDDIEAPSRLWENTITNETTLQTSPVKMVGLLRPSTILEECNEESTTSSTSCCTADISSLISFVTASKHEEEGATNDGDDEAASSCYDTAHDSTAASSNVVTNDNNAAGSVMQNEELMYFDDDDGDEEKADNSVEITCNLIDLEATFGPNRFSPSLSIELEEGREEGAAATAAVTIEVTPPKAPIAIISECDSESETSDSIIEIESDDEDGDDEMDKCSNNKSTQTPVKLEKVSIATDATFDVSDPAAAATFATNSLFVEPDNITKSLLDVDDGEEKSLHFNDTMEEVEYMMKKGMEYLAAAEANKAKAANSDIAEALHSPAVYAYKGLKENKLLQSPRANEQHYRSPSPMLHKHKPIFSPSIKGASSTGAKPKAIGPSSLAKPKPVNRFHVDIKPMPKLDLFKRPLPAHSNIPTSASMRHHKELTHKQFSHIVSPISAYVKKTATTPLMATMKDTPSNNAHNATVFRELEFESRSYHPKFETQAYNVNASAGTTITGGSNTKLPAVPCGLPKKAYISSQFKHIVDERTPVTIPGGKKIQRYLETAMLPAVVRHEGKIKMPTNVGGVAGAAPSTNTVTHSNNASLADLSLMSGDVSMYTIRDAQKFQH